MFSQDKCRVLHLAWTNPLHRYYLGTGRPGNSSAGNVPDVLVGPSAKGYPDSDEVQQHLQLYQLQSVDQVSSLFPLHITCTIVHSYSTACFLDPSVQERHGQIRSRVEGPKSSKSKSAYLWRRCWEAGLNQPGERTALGRHVMAILHTFILLLLFFKKNSGNVTSMFSMVFKYLQSILVLQPNSYSKTICFDLLCSLYIFVIQ